MEGNVEDGAGLSISVHSADGGRQLYSQCTIDEFRNQVSSFAAQLDSTAAVMEERSRKLREEEEKADRVRKELERKKEELERKFMELDAREEKFRLLLRKEVADRRKQESELVRKLKEEIERKSVEIEEQAAVIRRKQSELEVCMSELDARKKEIGEKENAVEAAKRKAVEFESTAEAAKRKFAELKERADAHWRNLVEKLKKEIETREKEIERKSKEIGEQAAEIRKNQSELEVRMSELDAREKEIDEKEKQCTRPWFEEQFKMLGKRVEDVVGEQFKVIGKTITGDFDSREKPIYIKNGESVLEVRELRDSLNHSSEAKVSAREKQLEEKLDREVELAKPVDNFDSKAVLKAKKLWESFDRPSEATISVCVTMNGKELQAYLNQHFDDHDSVKDEVERALKLSPDPTKLVLDAMEGFFEAGVVRKSCIVLLEWLTKMSPYIRPSVREEAKKLAFYWNETINKGSDADVDADHSLNVLAFLQLLAGFELTSCFDDDQLAIQLGVIARYSQAPMLLRELGFADKMSSIIQEKLIQKNHLAEAAGLISAFELHCEFSSVILPKGNHRQEFNLAPFLDNDAAPTITSVLRSFFKTVSTIRDLLSLSGQLSVWSDACADVNNTNCTDRVAVMCSNSLAHQRETSMLSARQPQRLPRPARLPEWLTSEQSCSNPSPRSSGHSEKRNEFDSSPWNLLFVPQCLETGGTYLEALCNKIASDKLFCIEISDALQLAPDPAEFVLGIAKNPSSLTLKRRHKQVRLAFPEHGLLLLLNRMWRMSPHVKSHVEREALSFAKNWKAKLAGKKGNLIEAVCFLLFLAAYKLVIHFDRDDLSCVVRVPTKLFRILGFNDYIPNTTNLGTSRPAPSDPTMSCCSSSSPAAPDENARKRCRVANEALEMPGSNATLWPPQHHLKKKKKKR